MNVATSLNRKTRYRSRVAHPESARPRSLGYRQDTLTSGNARSATRVDSFDRPFSHCRADERSQSGPVGSPAPRRSEFVRCELIANHERKTLGNQSTIVTSFLMNTRKTFKPLNVLKNATDEVVAESILLAIIEPRCFENVQACLKKKSYDHSASLESPLVQP